MCRGESPPKIVSVGAQIQTEEPQRTEGTRTQDRGEHWP